MKKIIIISYSYPPANAPAAQRPYAIAKYMDKTKYDITVITCSNADSSLGVSSDLDTELEDVKTIKVRALFSLKFAMTNKQSKSASTNNLLKKVKSSVIKTLQPLLFPDRAVLWLPTLFAYIYLHRKSLKTDIIISTSPVFTNHVAARFLKKFNKPARHLCDIRDFHYLLNFENSGSIQRVLHRELEKNIIKKSDIVTFVSPEMKTIYSNGYKQYKNKFHTVYNGYEENTIIELPPNNMLVISYAGSFYGEIRSPKPLLYAIEELIKTNKIEINKIEINIAGKISPKVITDLQSLMIYNRINFLGILSKQEIVRLYANSHFLWLIIGNTPNHYYTIPLKFFEYIGAKRHIINFSPQDSSVNNIIEKNNLGWNFENNSAEILYNSNLFCNIWNLFTNKSLNTGIDISGIRDLMRIFQIKKIENLIDETE